MINLIKMKKRELLLLIKEMIDIIGIYIMKKIMLIVADIVQWMKNIKFKFIYKKENNSLIERKLYSEC